MSVESNALSFQSTKVPDLVPIEGSDLWTEVEHTALVPRWDSLNKESLKDLYGERAVRQMWKRAGDVTVEVQKKDGSVRPCDAPNASTKDVQWSLLVRLYEEHSRRLADGLEGLWDEEVSFGFLPSTSTLDAVAHIRRNLAVNTGYRKRSAAYCDLKAAFPSVVASKVREVLLDAGLTGWSLELAVRVSTRRRPDGQMALSTGNPLSPTILNMVARGLDSDLNRLAKRWKGKAVRYCDDIVVTSGCSDRHKQLLKELKAAIVAHGFVPHPRKQGSTRTTRRARNHRHLAVEVTGTMVFFEGFGRVSVKNGTETFGFKSRQRAKRSYRKSLAAHIHAVRRRGENPKEDPKVVGRNEWVKASRWHNRLRPAHDYVGASAGIAIRRDRRVNQRRERREARVLSDVWLQITSGDIKTTGVTEAQVFRNLVAFHSGM